MTPPRTCFLLSPYRPPTSYPVTLSTDEAAAWLNGWAALWHPLALQHAALPPLPASSYDHNDPAPGGLYALAAGPSLHLADDWRFRARDAGAMVFDAVANRPETLRSLRDALGTPAEFDVVPGEVVSAFAGVGYAYLILETLFEAANHDKLLDVEGFWNDITAAVESRLNPSTALAHLTDAALKLTTAREALASSGIQFIDIILRDAVTHQEPWPRPLTAAQPATLVATAATLAQLQVANPDAFHELKHAAAGSIDLAIGVVSERDDSLLPVESQLWSLRKAVQDCEALLDRPATLFARGTADYHAHLPGWLVAAGFKGVLLLNREQAMLPSFSSSIIQWPGPDGRIINAYTRTPLPAGDANTFFNLAYHLHEATQRESSPHFALLHTHAPCDSYRDLLAAHALAPIFGSATGLESLLADSHTADYVSVQYADEYAVDHLDNAVSKRHEKDPISRFALQQRTRRRIDSCFALAALHRTLTTASDQEIQQIEALQQFEDRFELGAATADLAGVEQYFVNRLTERILARSNPGTPGHLVFNTCNFPRRVALEFADAVGPIAMVESIKASEYEGGTARVVLEVPGLGYAWIPRGDAKTILPKPRLKTAEGFAVRNEFLEVEVDPATGGIKALRDTRLRIHRLGQMLSWNPGSKMIADDVRVTAAGPTLGEITSRGKLLDDAGAVLATFTQRVRAWVGRPVLELQITLQPATPPQGYAWQNYFGCRFAWREERAAFSRGVQGTLHPSGLHRPNTPDFVEVRYGKERTVIFTGGLPFVQKQGQRMADVLLACEGENATTFDLLLAFDRDYPMATATGWTTPTPMVTVDRGPPPSGASGWLASVDLPSLVMTGFRPAEPEDGHSRAVVMRLLETAGFAAAADLRFARDPQRVSTCDLAGRRELPLTMAGDAVPLAASAGELLHLKAEWQ